LLNGGVAFYFCGTTLKKIVGKTQTSYYDVVADCHGLRLISSHGNKEYNAGHDISPSKIHSNQKNKFTSIK